MGARCKIGKGFSLIEVVLALGVISFALVGIMGLFPVAMRSAQESQRETKAAVIAQQIFGDLKSLPGAQTLLVRGPTVANVSSRIPVNLGIASTYVLAYNDKGEGLTDSVDPAAFTNALTLPDAAYLAQVVITPDQPAAGLSRVQARIEAPPNAPSANRSRYTFVTVMSQN